jgi:CRP/FNR family transcriptional regulator, anaerobic regulatory protein
MQTCSIARPERARPSPHADADRNQRHGEKVTTLLKLLADTLSPQRRVVHAGDVVYQAGASFGNLHILNSGFCKVVSLSADGREQVVALKFRGDWLGLDGIGEGRYTSDAIAMDTGEVWTVSYDALLGA